MSSIQTSVEGDVVANNLHDSIAIGDDVRDFNDAGEAIFVENKEDARTSTNQNVSNTSLYVKRLSKEGRIL